MEIEWNNLKFKYSNLVFSPKQSTLGILNEIFEVTKLFNNKIPIIDMCCGIGAIGISSYVNYSNVFNNYIGLDNDKKAIEICNVNIMKHGVNGIAKFWEAGNPIPKESKGIVVCNPPFLPNTVNYSKHVLNNQHVFSNNYGIEIILKCFKSNKDTGHVFILKSLKNQIERINESIGSEFRILKQKNIEIESNYIITFSTWIQK